MRTLKPAFRPLKEPVEWPLWGVLEVFAVVLAWFTLTAFLAISYGGDLAEPLTQLVVSAGAGVGVCLFVAWLARSTGQPLAVVGLRTAGSADARGIDLIEHAERAYVRDRAVRPSRDQDDSLITQWG